VRVILTAERMVKVPVTWNIQTSLGPPSRVMSSCIKSVPAHLCSLGFNVNPPTTQTPKFKKSGLERPAVLV
jgi:hypothetical protein